jgi:hypothetical protein
MITITQEDLIEYHTKTYMPQFVGHNAKFRVDSGSVDTASNLAPDLPPYSPSHSNTTKPSNEPINIKTSFTIDELQADAEEFEDKINNNLEHSLQDQKVLQYLTFQKDHKQNFLEEVRKKGLTITSKNNQKSAEINQQRKPPMNY